MKILQYRATCPQCPEELRYTTEDPWRFCPLCGTVLNVEAIPAKPRRRGEPFGGAKSLDKALTVAEVSTITGLSPQTITRMFEKEPGIIVLNRPEKMHKRRYRSIRIPRVVCDRVLRRFTL